MLFLDLQGGDVKGISEAHLFALGERLYTVSLEGATNELASYYFNQGRNTGHLILSARDPLTDTPFPERLPNLSGKDYGSIEYLSLSTSGARTCFHIPSEILVLKGIIFQQKPIEIFNEFMQNPDRLVTSADLEVLRPVKRVAG